MTSTIEQAPTLSAGDLYTGPYPYFGEDGMVHFSQERLVQSGPRIVGTVGSTFSTDLPETMKCEDMNYYWAGDSTLSEFDLLSADYPEQFREATELIILDYRAHFPHLLDAYLSLDARQHRQGKFALSGAGVHADGFMGHEKEGRVAYIVSDPISTLFTLTDIATHGRISKRESGGYDSLWEAPPRTIVTTSRDTAHTAPKLSRFKGEKRTFFRIDFYPN